jgi:hypothetical protein
VRTAIYKERRIEHDRFYDLVHRSAAAAFTIHGKSFVTTRVVSFASVIHHTGTDYLHKIQIINLKTVK